MKQSGKFSGVFGAFLPLTSFLLELFFMVRAMVQQEAAGSLGLGCGCSGGSLGMAGLDPTARTCPTATARMWDSQGTRTAPAQASPAGPMARLADSAPPGVEWGPGPQAGQEEPWGGEQG